MNSSYVHVLVDPDPLGSNGQLVCNDCKLEGKESLENWEEFLNGSWVTDDPTVEGYYPVLLGAKKVFIILYARAAKNSRTRVVWDEATPRTRIRQRWSSPYPHPPEGIS